MNNEQFKRKRMKLDLTQKQLAYLLRVSVRTIFYWESGVHEIPYTVEYWMNDQIGKLP